jgi:hypothetical protein
MEMGKVAALVCDASGVITLYPGRVPLFALGWIKGMSVALVCTPSYINKDEV